MGYAYFFSDLGRINALDTHFIIPSMGVFYHYDVAVAFDAVASLRVKGLKARRLEDGFPEWKTVGLPVETGNI